LAEIRRTLERLTENERRALARLAWVALNDLAGILLQDAGQVAEPITDSVMNRNATPDDAMVAADRPEPWPPG